MCSKRGPISHLSWRVSVRAAVACSLDGISSSAPAWGAPDARRVTDAERTARVCAPRHNWGTFHAASDGKGWSDRWSGETISEGRGWTGYYSRNT